MVRRFVNQLRQRESVDQVFRAENKQLRPNRNGNLYLQVDLSDRTGTISARLWNASEAIYKSFDNGDFVHVRGTTQVFQGALQIIVTKLERVDPRQVNEDDFFPVPVAELESLFDRASTLLRTLRDPHLQALAECFLMDEQLVEQLRTAPAGIRHHHAYRGGLLKHLVTVMELAATTASHYPEVDRDLLILGAFLHDLGKLAELKDTGSLDYTDQGQLLGHIVLGIELLNTKVHEAETLLGESFDQEKLLRLKHIVVSHHGEKQYGSPCIPMTPEAIVLHYIDCLDAQVTAAMNQIREDANVGARWTNYDPTLGRRIFKGKAESH